MNLDVNQMLDAYSEWLRKEITVVEFGEFQEITTPYLDRFNDYLQLYVKLEKDGSIFITDDGVIIDNLIMSGICLRKNSSKKKLLEKIVTNYGMQLQGNDMVACCTVENFPQVKHRMVQAMLLVDDMFQLNRENATNLFVEELADFFDTNQFYPFRDFSLVGKTGSIYSYDFVFNRSATKPERFCRGINKINETNRNTTIFNWIDTKEQRKGDSMLYIVINDNNTVKPADLEAFANYDINPILFSERNKKKHLFSA